jgi:hypothetical protein
MYKPNKKLLYTVLAVITVLWSLVAVALCTVMLFVIAFIAVMTGVIILDMAVDIVAINLL